MTTTALQTHNLGKLYQDKWVVNALNLTVNEGECVGIIGPNGAGKTTTIKMCLGHVMPDQGRIEIYGLSVPLQAQAVRKLIGVVAQSNNLDPDFSVAENLITYGRFYGLSRRHMIAKLPELLEFADLIDKKDAKIEALSGGMQRRLSIARALVADARALFLDEPTTGLDPQARHLIWSRLKMLLSQGKTLLLTTHFMEEAERLCDRVIVMDQGQIVAQGAPKTLISSMITPEVVEFFGQDKDAAWQLLNEQGYRLESIGDTGFIYSADSKAALNKLSHFNQLSVQIRPSNLEDVFFKLTGRQLSH